MPILGARPRKAGASAQVAGGVPAMCDGVTQGRPGMELSLFSRDVIALSTAVAMTHDAFDAGLMLGTCDKIVPGLVIGALSFGHLPVIFSPAGPMPSGINNKEKAKVRELFALGQVTRDQLLEAEAASYHTAGPMRFFKDVLVPLSKTSIAALFVIQFIYGWNQYLWPLLMTTTEDMYPVVIGIKRMVGGGGEASIDWNIAMATAILAMLPPAAVVILMQKWFVKGLVDTEK